MKKLLILMACVALAACGGSKYGKGVPAQYDTLLDAAMAKAGDNADQLNIALDQCPEAQREGMAFLIAYMPESDLQTLTSSFLLDNVDYAYLAREKYEWAKNLPDSIFFNDVLPYAVIDETRDEWRREFYEIFGKRVEGITDVFEAAAAINSDVNVSTGVEYNTLREKTNQSPAESMRQGMASCTGLAVILADAFRSVGIPARFAGTASWHDNRGNHSWVEVWLDGKWYITEFYKPAEFDKPWFMANAGKADPADRVHAIYATSYKPTGDYFPMVWSAESKQVHGENVTQRYVDIADAVVQKAEELGTHAAIELRMFAKKAANYTSGDRVATNVDVFCGATQMDGGRTAGPTQDMNDVLSFLLEKNQAYTFKYADAKGQPVAVNVELGDEPVVVDLFME